MPGVGGGVTQRLFSKPSEAEEQLSRADLGKGGSLGVSFLESHWFLGPVVLSSKDKEPGRGK